MTTNEGYYGVTRTDEYLAHYGIKGMKWGVRKAIESGNSARLGRQYRKAQKKLAKLEARANNGKKYAKRAAALGAGAAAAGTLASKGTVGVANFLRGSGANAVGAAGRGAGAVGGMLMKSRNAKIRRAGIGIMGAGTKMQKSVSAVRGAGDVVSTFGRGTGASEALTKGAKRAANFASKHGLASPAARGYDKVRRSLDGVSNNTLARIGAGAAAAGLGAGAAYNAYRAATTKRAAKKAAQFRSEMNKAFAGTQYGKKPRQGKRRRG